VHAFDHFIAESLGPALKGFDQRLGSFDLRR
jgi:hypothetical protein